MVNDPEVLVRIEVYDGKDPNNKDALSSCDVKMLDLLHPADQAHDMYYDNFSAGKIFFTSDFQYKKLDMEALPQKYQVVKLPQTIDPNAERDTAAKKQGNLKLFLKEAKLTAVKEKVSPYVVCHLGFFEWKSPAPMDKDVSALLWSDLDYFKYDVFKPEELMVIEVKNADSDRGKQILGRVEVPAYFFA